ncbi:hypothetical protein AB0D11_02625 [Streptomyces monashensis]|uniref:hypothetical protein n=1 Tax=Streptomyces monashensis TaxID=1678012 RepID=UPI0033C0FFD9
MPTSKSTKDAPETPQPEEAAAPAAETTAAAPEPEPEPEPSGLEPGVYEYMHFSDCVYPSVPLTARAAVGDTPPTVFDWPFGPPDDGRWTKTRKKPNQAADNEAAPSSEE